MSLHCCSLWVSVPSGQAYNNRESLRAQLFSNHNSTLGYEQRAMQYVLFFRVMWMIPVIHRFLTELVRLKWLNIYTGQVLFFFLKMERDGGVRDWKNKANINPCWPNKLGQWRIYNVAFGESFACGTRRVVPSERMDYLRSMRSSWWDNSQIFFGVFMYREKSIEFH